MLRPKTPEELLDREEALALHAITQATERFGDDLCEVTRVRERIRSHPWTALALGGLCGFLCGPAALRFLTRIPGMLARNSGTLSKGLDELHPLGARLLAALRTHDAGA